MANKDAASQLQTTASRLRRETIRREIKIWRKVVRDAGIKVE